MDRDQRLIEFCQEAIRIPSPSGQEQGVAQLMKRKMEEYGFDEVVIDRYGSVLGRMRGKRPGKTILLDGHIDNVDVIDAGEWTHDPFGGEIDQGRIYGRGTSDMKGSVTAMISAVAHFAEDTGRDFAGRSAYPVLSTRSALRGSPPGRSPAWRGRTSSSSVRRPPPPSRSARGAGRRWSWRQRGSAVTPPTLIRASTRSTI